MSLIQSSTHTRCRRRGLSIIEVLTSIVVAMIGVFGVMALIPFAVKQAQQGLDSDAATIVARNAFDQFEVAGYRNHENWIIGPGNANAENWNLPVSIDPLGLVEAEITPDSGTVDKADFPFNRSSAVGKTAYPDPDYIIQAASLRLPIATVTPFTTADARRMFRAADDLVFGAAQESAPGAGDADLQPPTQLFDQNGTTNLRRQSIGKFSWSAIVVPVQAAGVSSTTAWKYRMYILVYKDRIPSAVTEDPTNQQQQMATALVADPNDLGGYVQVNNITIEAGVPIDASLLRSGDWVMLINRGLIGGVANGDFQLGFYRLVNFDASDIASGARMTLDGPDFDFGKVVSSNKTRGPTHVVHLKNVVGVYERTFTPEGASNWSLTY